jgi:hypothetical protein
MTMKRWEEVYSELQRKAERLGYAPPLQIGSANSQTFEFKLRGNPVLLLAFRDLAHKPDYAVDDRLWAEGLDLVLSRYQDLAKQGQRLPQAAAIVIDNIGNSFIVVMMTELLDLYRQKGVPDTPDGSRRFTFVVRREGGSYYLQMPYGRPSVRLTAVNSVEDLVLLLKAAKAPQ